MTTRNNLAFASDAVKTTQIQVLAQPKTLKQNSTFQGLSLEIANYVLSFTFKGKWQ